MPGMVMAARPSSRTRYDAAIVAILAVYLLGRAIEVLPFTRPSTPIVALEILSALGFALAHGARVYGVRRIGIFVAVCLVVGGGMEAIGLRTGIPFGHYEFLPLMGPQILRVPILLGLAYVGMAYVSWMVARLILRTTGADLSGVQALNVAVLASAVMTAWDFAQDPVWSTLLHAWRWRDGGAWFGVPLTNFGGWLLTTFLIYAVFAAFLRRLKVGGPVSADRNARDAVLLYALCALGNVLQLVKPQAESFVVDGSGTLWRTGSILRASAVASVLLMGTFVVLAWLRAPENGLSAIRD
jgi:putative membrane protein